MTLIDSILATIQENRNAYGDLRLDNQHTEILVRYMHANEKHILDLKACVESLGETTKEEETKILAGADWATTQ